jgi:hypothetical protein
MRTGFPAGSHTHPDNDPLAMMTAHFAAAVALSALALLGCTDGFRQGVADGLADSTKSAEAQDRLLFGLRSIDPALSENRDRALERAKNVCADIADGKEDKVVVDNARQRFDVTGEQARQIVKLTKMTVC